MFSELSSQGFESPVLGKEAKLCNGATQHAVPSGVCRSPEAFGFDDFLLDHTISFKKILLIQIE